LELYQQLLGSEVMRNVTIRTVSVSMIVTALCVVLAYPLALFIARSRHSNLMLVLVISPWLTSIVVRTFAWMIVLGNRGALNSFLMSVGILDAPLRIIFTPTAVVIGLVHVFVPFMIISILSVLQQQDRRLIEAGMSLGAGRIETFLRVTLPLSLPGVISGVAIVYMLCSGAIVTPLLLGGMRDRLLGTQIYQDLTELFDYRRAAGTAGILLLTSLIVVIPLQHVEARVRRWTRG
jgi:putative spermidine/putrescine transport system permease protein